MRIFWGDKDGINKTRYQLLGRYESKAEGSVATTTGWLELGNQVDSQDIKHRWRDIPFMPEQDKVLLYPVYAGKGWHAAGNKLRHVVSASSGDINGDGFDDLVLAVCHDRTKNELLYLLGLEGGLQRKQHYTFETISACDVLVCDITGSGCADVILCQGRTSIMNTTESLVFKGTRDGIATVPVIPKPMTQLRSLPGKPAPAKTSR